MMSREIVGTWDGSTNCRVEEDHPPFRNNCLIINVCFVWAIIHVWVCYCSYYPHKYHIQSPCVQMRRWWPRVRVLCPRSQQQIQQKSRKSQFFCLWAVWPWASSFTSLSIIFFVYKMGVIILKPFHIRLYMGIQWDDGYGNLWFNKCAVLNKIVILVSFFQKGKRTSAA